MVKLPNGSPKILVIDDDPSAIELFQILLAMTDYDVLTASSGKEGIELARRLKPDLIILDLLMPRMDGLQVCSEIREFSKIPIIIISVIASSEVITKALNLGADEYLTKPVSPNMLTATSTTFFGAQTQKR
ncbi:MAG: Alkaline phosphatase synthesis transcriptional regulatory protein PhoP [Chloroflexi bacterium]|nr:Alkaline phosphatase synthesis transcriptional regulatory protein PhoP [Chloroflexota bacterium]